MPTSFPYPKKRQRNNGIKTMFKKAEGRTKQSHRAECDINTIVSRYTKEGVLTHVNLREPRYGVVPATDFSQAMRLVTTAQETFEQLPAHLRKRFGHSAESFLSFASDPANEAEMVELGLLDEKPADPPAEPASPPEEGDTPDPVE